MRREMAAAKGCIYMYHGRSLDSSAVDTAENKARKLWGQACDLLAHGTDCVHQVRLGFWSVQMQGQPPPSRHAYMLCVMAWMQLQCRLCCATCQGVHLVCPFVSIHCIWCENKSLASFFWLLLCSWLTNWSRPYQCGLAWYDWGGRTKTICIA